MTEWPFHETYKVDLPPTQIKAAVERCKKKNIVDLSAPSDETLAVITQVRLAYSKKKERSRAASSRARAKAAEEPLDIEAAPVAVEPEAGICEVVAEAEPPIVEHTAAPEPAAAAPPKAAPRAAKSRVDNVAAPAHPAVVAPPAPAPAPKRAAAEAPARRRGGGLAAMIADVAI